MTRELGAAVALALAFGLGACGVQADGSAHPTEEPTASPPVDRGYGTRDASGDVRVGEPEPNGWGTEVTVTVTNRSGKASDYYVELVADSLDGSRQLGWTNVLVSRLSPGQRTEQTATFTTEFTSSTGRVRVAEVSRTAS